MEAKIIRFKRWYQVTVNDYTIAQFLQRKDAEIFLLSASTQFPSLSAGIRIQSAGRWRVSKKTKINLYP